MIKFRRVKKEKEFWVTFQLTDKSWIYFMGCFLGFWLISKVLYGMDDFHANVQSGMITVLCIFFFGEFQIKKVKN